MVDSWFYWVGFAVCAIGGMGVVALVSTWALDKILTATRNMSAVAQWWFEKKYPKRFKD